MAASREDEENHARHHEKSRLGKAHGAEIQVAREVIIYEVLCSCGAHSEDERPGQELPTVSNEGSIEARAVTARIVSGLPQAVGGCSCRCLSQDR